MAKASALDIYVKSKAKAKAEAKRLALKEVDKLISVLQEVKAELEQKESERAEKEKQQNIERIQALMAESGLTADDISGSAKRAKKAKTQRGAKAKSASSRPPVAPKYRLVIEGEEYLWTGRGRTPRVFQDYFDAGNSRESCAI
jgi:DNA-binding protein H-NS